MDVTLQDVRDVIGSDNYRNQCVREALANGKSRMGPLTLRVNAQSQMMEVTSTKHKTMVDLSALTTEADSSVKKVREKLDSIAMTWIGDTVHEFFWQQ